MHQVVVTFSNSRIVTTGWFVNNFQFLTRFNALFSEVIPLSITFNCDDCNNPDDVGNYLQYILRDIAEPSPPGDWVNHPLPDYQN